MSHRYKFIKIIKSELFKYLKDVYIVDKTDEFRLDSLNFYLYCFDEYYKNLLNILPIKHKT